MQEPRLSSAAFKQLSIREKTEFFQRVEQLTNPFLLERAGVGVWPIIKAYLFLGDAWAEKYGVGIPLGKRVVQTSKVAGLIVKTMLKSRQVRYRERRPNDSATAIDLLFWINHAERRDQVGGKAFSRFLSALQVFAEEIPQLRQASVDILPLYELPSQNVYAPRDRLYQSIHLSNLRGALGWLTMAEADQQAYITGFTDWLGRLESAGFDGDLFRSLVYPVVRVFDQAKAIEDYLRQRQPKSVIFTAYYSTLSFALQLAARKLGVKTVEIQHGQQGKFHPMYTNWVLPDDITNIPTPLIPDRFWMWGEMSQQRIDAWLPKAWSQSTLNGGNPWLAFVRRRGMDTDEQTKRSLDGIKNDHRRMALVSVQFTKDLLEGPLPEAMLLTKEKVLWLVRLHPRFKTDAPKIAAYFADFGIENYDMAFATEAPLYSLFGPADVHLTGWSTVAYEAEAFGLPTIIIHPNGLDAMREYINEQVFKYADSPEAIAEMVVSGWTPKVPQRPYISADADKIQRQLMNL